MPTPTVIISTKNLTKYYGKQRGIEGLTLDVHRGEVFGFLGPNGAGKTTTINLLMGFRRPTRGHATIFNQQTGPTQPELHRRIGFMPGELSLYEKLTAQELFTYLGNLRGGLSQSYLKSLIERFGLDAHRKIKQLSKGNKQKVGLIQALMHKPDILILDEPTSGLDPLMQREFYKLVTELKRQKKTVFLSSHVMSEVEKICDRVGIVRDGRLITTERIVSLHERSLRHLEIHFEGRPTKAILQKIPGVKDIHIDGRIMTCTVHGSMDRVVKALAKHKVRNLISEHASLEELFFEEFGGSYAG